MGKNMQEENVLEKIDKAEMVLVGLGEEFDGRRFCKSCPGYDRGRDMLQNSDYSYLLPVYDALYRKEEDKRIRKVLEKLERLLSHKNYFVAATARNDVISQIPWKADRLTTPCGGSRNKQCIHGCGKALAQLTEGERATLADRVGAFIHSVRQGKEVSMESLGGVLGNCPECGAPMILNNVDAGTYDENGYLPSWQVYRSWLQGTLNKRFLILELGVGMECPTVIRWPFEKMAFYNQKAFLYRVHESLYQLTEELQGKAVSICKNSIDWLEIL